MVIKFLKFPLSIHLWLSNIWFWACLFIITKGNSRRRLRAHVIFHVQFLIYKHTYQIHFSKTYGIKDITTRRTLWTTYKNNKIANLLLAKHKRSLQRAAMNKTGNEMEGYKLNYFIVFSWLCLPQHCIDDMQIFKNNNLLHLISMWK